jgi:succinate dehydrogenase/fumarate reductase flavoprotein subunit
LVVEKSRYIGGTTAFSGGGAWIPVNRHQAASGIKDDSAANSDRYLENVLGDAYEKEKIHAFLYSSPRMLQWMESNTDVQFQPVSLPDYHSTMGGASIGRTVFTKEFDGRVLGSRIRDVRYTLQGFHVFGSLQVDPSELAIMADPFGSARNLKILIRKLSRFLWDKMRYGKSTVLANGNALVGRLLFSCLKAGVEVQTSCPALRPIQGDNGATIGLVVRLNGEEKSLTASKGVVLASGGFGRGREARSYVPHDWSAQPQSVVGDGIRVGREFGAVLPPPNADNGIFAPISLLEKGDGQIRRYPHFYLDRTKPGAVIVGPDGRRFTNEAAPYQEFVRKMHELGLEKVYLIADRSFLRKYGMGMALPRPYPVSHLVRQGYLVESPTLEDLAERIGVPPDNLHSTVCRMNDYARTGVDLEFGRGNDNYDRFNGDANSGMPNPNLGTCGKPPFYALPLRAGNVSTIYGLHVNENAQALDKAGTPISKLYAIGLDQNSIFKGHYPGGGCSIGPAMTFGYRAALHMAGLQDEM